MRPVFISVPPMIRDIISRVIRREGGYVDHPSDPGGATNMGITFETLRRWRGEPITKLAVKNLQEQEAVQIYYQEYWEPINLHHIQSWWLREFIFDWVVNAGLKNPIRQIQKLVGVRRDGLLGPVTAHAIQQFVAINGNRGHGYIVDCRVKWYIRLVESKHTRIVFMEGWFNRANEMRYLTTPYSNR